MCSIAFLKVLNQQVLNWTSWNLQLLIPPPTFLDCALWDLFQALVQFESLKMEAGAELCVVFIFIFFSVAWSTCRLVRFIAGGWRPVDEQMWLIKQNRSATWGTHYTSHSVGPLMTHLWVWMWQHFCYYDFCIFFFDCKYIFVVLCERKWLSKVCCTELNTTAVIVAKDFVVFKKVIFATLHLLHI